MATPNEAQIQAYIAAQVNARVDAAVAEISANINHGGVKSVKYDTYDGRKDPDMWIYGIELCFSAASVTADYLKITLADARLRGDALVWRRTVPHPDSWDEWKALLTSAFQPINPAETARDRLARLRQTTSVRTYAAVFRTVTLLIPTITDDEKKDRFIRGLKPKIMSDIKVKAPHTFEEAVKIAVRLDSLDTWRPSSSKDQVRPGTSKASYSDPMDVDVNAITSTPAAVRSDVNAIANSRPGPSGTFNSRPPRKPLTDREREELKKKGICFKCRKPGHIARECPEASNSSRR